jgi:ZIP family zinc transporter
LAIALHNIPEGVAIAIPCIAARPDAPWLAFFLASASGLAEPLGAGIAIWILDGRTSVSTTDHGILLGMILNMKNVLAFVAGIMIMVAVMELFPEAKRHMKQDRWPGIAGTFLGIIIMLASDAYLEGT